MNRLRLLCILVVVGVLAIAAFDGLAPRALQRNLKGLANETAARAENEYFASGDETKAAVVARRVAVDNGATLTSFRVDPGGGVTVTVSDQARSIILSHLGIRSLTERTQVSVTATVGAKAGEPPTSTTTR